MVLDSEEKKNCKEKLRRVLFAMQILRTMQEGRCVLRSVAMKIIDWSQVETKEE
jgi:hypothetical protein